MEINFLKFGEVTKSGRVYNFSDTDVQQNSKYELFIVDNVDDFNTINDLYRNGKLVTRGLVNKQQDGLYISDFDTEEDFILKILNDGYSMESTCVGEVKGVNSNYVVAAELKSVYIQVDEDVNTFFRRYKLDELI